VWFEIRTNRHCGRGEQLSYSRLPLFLIGVDETRHVVQRNDRHNAHEMPQFSLPGCSLQVGIDQPACGPELLSPSDRSSEV
jgi:hypothetical protein